MPRQNGAPSLQTHEEGRPIYVDGRGQDKHSTGELQFF
jgi:hypothetical protein